MAIDGPGPRGPATLIAGRYSENRLEVLEDGDRQVARIDRDGSIRITHDEFVKLRIAMERQVELSERIVELLERLK